jgi:hypothetical protein
MAGVFPREYDPEERAKALLAEIANTIFHPPKAPPFLSLIHPITPPPPATAAQISSRVDWPATAVTPERKTLMMTE